MRWELLTDSVTDEPLPTEKLVDDLLSFLSAVGAFSGTAAELSEALLAHCSVKYPANALSRKLRSFASELQIHGYDFRFSRTHDRRLLELSRVSCVSSDGFCAVPKTTDASDADGFENGKTH